ncbi:hypothetical protein [Streptomyces minutiscleroticus]|nr:hypothetical protein [Streptomyces minutiscleroticus]
MSATGRAAPARLARTAALRITHRAPGEGIDFVDTADVYWADATDQIVDKAGGDGSRRT